MKPGGFSRQDNPFLASVLRRSKKSVSKGVFNEQACPYKSFKLNMYLIMHNTRIIMIM